MGKIFVIRDLYSENIKTSYEATIKKINKPFFKWAKHLTRDLSKEDMCQLAHVKMFNIISH